MNMGGKQSMIENVVAIDFGTTNSGYAYSLGKGKEIKTNPQWSNNNGRILTDVLLDAKLSTALAFGPTALREYARAVEKYSEKVCEWSDSEESMDYQISQHVTTHPISSLRDEDLRDSVLLEKIKLQILDLRDATNFQVTAVNREKVQAVQAFAPALDYMKQCCMKQIQTDNDNLEGRDILWIVTVPASWEIKQRNFMAMAALRSGVMASGATKNFIIITESEASAYFCRALKAKEFTDPQAARNHTSEQNYIVVDAGGGTVDITVVSKNEDSGDETEAHESSGGRWGGETVNERFEDHILQASPIIREFKERYIEPIQLWDIFMDDYNATKMRNNGEHDVAIHLKKDFIDSYNHATDRSILEELARNSNIVVNQQEMSLTLKAECLRKKQFDPDYQTLQNTFKDNNTIWNDFDREFKRLKKRFDSNNDRQFDVEIKLDDNFIGMYKQLTGNSFGTGPGIGTEPSDTKVWFKSETSHLVFPSYAMKWCYYDDILLDKFEPLEKLCKHRAWIWRKFMKSFEKAKRDFSGEKDVEMSVDDKFLEEFKSSTQELFGDDLKSTHGIGYAREKLKISKQVMKDICFQPVTSKIINFLKKCASKRKSIGVLYLVGGFGQQRYLQFLLKKEFPEMPILIPKDAHTSVMKGAISYAYSRVSTTEHIAKCTFSAGKRRDDNRPDRPSTPRDINQHCSLVTLVEKDEKIKVSQIVQEETLPYNVSDEFGDKFVIEIFTSTYKGPKTPSKAKRLCYFPCKNGNTHVVTISFTASDVRFHVNEKDTGNSTVRRITQSKLENLGCTIL